MKYCKECGSKMIPFGQKKLLEYDENTGKPKFYQEMRCEKNPCHYPLGHDWKNVNNKFFFIKNILNSKYLKQCTICKIKVVDEYGDDY